MAVIQLSATILHCFIWYGRIRRGEINKSGYEWLRSSISKDVTLRWWAISHLFLFKHFKHKTNVVCQWEWQIDLMSGHSNPLMEVINAEQWGETTMWMKKKNGGMYGSDFFPAIIKSSAESRPTEMLQSWLCHQQDNYLLDLNSIL